jgi:hypothetical protein
MRIQIPADIEFSKRIKAKLKNEIKAGELQRVAAKYPKGVIRVARHLSGDNPVLKCAVCNGQGKAICSFTIDIDFKLNLPISFIDNNISDHTDC